MDRPTSPELDAIMSAAEELRLLEARAAAEIAEAKRGLASKVEALVHITEPSDLLRAAVYAYWHAPEVSANQLAVLTVGKPSVQLMLRRSGAVSIGLSCDRCARELPITSRSMMSSVLKAAADNQSRYAEGYRFLCPSCQEAVFDEREEARLRSERDNEARRQALARIEYSDYLETEDWKNRRESVKAWMLAARGKLSCEVCPEREDLSFVHTQFDLMNGAEAVALLCSTCSEALERAGKLARSPLKANRAPRIELDLAERSFRAERHEEEDAH